VEFVSRSDPDEPSSVFQIADATLPNPDRPWEWVLTWDTAAGRFYKVFCHTNIATPWPSIPVYQVEGDGTPRSYTNTTFSTHPRFYRLTVELLLVQ
jgi:hypothetical protein